MVDDGATSDRQLLEAWRAGDNDAGEQLFDRYYDSVVRFFRNKVRADAFDLVQQTFAACLTGRDRIRDTGSFRSYLFGVAYNTLRAHFRARVKDRDNLDFEHESVADLAPGPSTAFARQREQRLLLEALRHIPVEHQALLELRFWEDLKTIEIADILAIPHGTVRSRLRRAMALLREAIDALAESPAVLDSTLANLDDWAAQCRAAVGRSDDDSDDDSDG